MQIQRVKTLRFFLASQLSHELKLMAIDFLFLNERESAENLKSLISLD